jgi:hypothetical protein
MSQLPKHNETPDGYRPVMTPRAVKMINRGNLEENEQELNMMTNDLQTKRVQSYTHMTYETIYTSDMQKTIKWYNKAFGFQILTINPDFSVVEISPGKIIEVSATVKGPLKIGFVTKNMNALIRQLERAHVEFETSDDSQLRLTDPDGNTIEVRTQGYGVQWLTSSVPSLHSAELTRCYLESKDTMHLVARRIMDDSEFEQAAEELIHGCRRKGISTEGEVFIVSDCRHTEPHFAGQARATKVDNLFACITITDAFDGKLLEGMEHLEIPPQDYTVFPIDYCQIDGLRTHIYGWRSNFMTWSFTRPDGNFYILEQYKDDKIYTFIPYHWNKGWHEQYKLEEEKKRLEGKEVNNDKSEVELI